MSRDTTDMLDRVAKVNAAVLERQAKAEREKEEARELRRMADRRSTCLALALVAFVVGVLLSIGHWTHTVQVPPGVISWLGAGLTVIFSVGAVAAQIAINQRKTDAASRRTNERMDAAAAKLREEIREAFVTLRVELEAGCARFVEGIDTAAIARLAGQLQAIEASIPALRATVDLPGTVEEAIRKAHASGYVSGVQQRLNGTGGALIPLHKP